MSTVPPNQDPLVEVDQLYRRLSGLDPGRPGEWVRRKVQAYAAQQAAERAVRANVKAKDATAEVPALKVVAAPTEAVPTANKPWLLPAVIGAIVAAGLIGFLIYPRVMGSHDAPKAALPPAPVSPMVTPEPQVAQDSAPSPSDSVPAAPAAPPSSPLESSASSVPAAPSEPPAPAAKSTAQTPPAARPSATPPPVVASSPAGKPSAPVLPKSRVARQNAATSQSAPISSDRAADTARQTARPVPTPDSAPAPKTAAPAPSAETQVASAPPPKATPPAPPPAPAATPVDATPSNPPDELWLAAKNGDMKALQSALAGNVAVDAFDENGETALILAIQHSHVEAVRALLAHGANPNTPDSHGLTPVRAARIRDNFAIKTALERNGKH